ncbi:MAG: prepilin-type N-terminal cleavage/methylation domain-containing protein, partial [Gammaproteobacteria bacterium]|nr:prepilin-type N-terminal cleavage/methylation domain-containing protein [Gammaproteobacteria bacterium]MBU1831570.1 prepilin-type N-terminal cleavage/methylation domain-containing protein [Gammaproteobacteria bacterium]
MVKIKQKAQQGFGLVELMISITLGLVLSTAVIQVFVASNSSSTLQQSLAQVQENARFAMRMLGEEIRMSGYMGCTSIGTVAVNSIAIPTADVNFGPATVFVGQDDLGAGNALGAIVGSDAIQVKRASVNFIRLDGSTTAETDFLNINSNTLGFVQNDFVLVSDCLNADIFRVTNTPAQSGATTLYHASGTKNSSGTLGKRYGPDSEIFGFETKSYFIRDTGRDTPGGNPINALYVQQTVAGSGGVASAATELVEG